MHDWRARLLVQAAMLQSDVESFRNRTRIMVALATAGLLVASGIGLAATRSSRDVAGVVVYELGLANPQTLDGRWRSWLMTAALDGSGARTLTTQPQRGDRHDSEVTLSPDGSQVAFVREGSGGTALFVASLDGGGIRRLIGEKEIRHGTIVGGERWISGPVWSPDGTKIAFAGGNCTASRSTSLYTIGADGRNLTALPSVPTALKRSNDFLWIVPEAWSRDSMLLYSLQTWEVDCYRDSHLQDDSLYAIGSDGTGRALLVDNGSTFVGQASWSADGHNLAFSVDEGGGPHPCAVYLVTSGSKPSLLASFGNQVWCGSGPGFAWDPTGSSLIVGARKSINRLDITTRRQTPIVRKGSDDCCWISPDGQLIGFLTSLQADKAAYVATTDGRIVTKLKPPAGTLIKSIDIRYR